MLEISFGNSPLVLCGKTAGVATLGLFTLSLVLPVPSSGESVEGWNGCETRHFAIYGEPLISIAV